MRGFFRPYNCSRGEITMNLPINQILKGDCVELMNSLPEHSIDLIFADPPYNLQLQKTLHRPNMSRVEAVNDAWDQFGSFEEYDRFTRAWLSACKRILKPTGTIWVIGSYHNIFRVGTVMQDLGFWLLNDVIWVKTNPMPNFRGVRFTNAHETMIWASSGKGAKYTFNHQAMKGLNEEKQMRSDWWLLSLATGVERIRDANGMKVHSTQKPESLLYRILLASSKPGDVVLDPFFGSGTTGAVAKRLKRNWVGLEREPKYIRAAKKRIDAILEEPFEPSDYRVAGKAKSAPRVAFSVLVEDGLLRIGQKLFFQKDKERYAFIRSDARLRTMDGFIGSIHQTTGHFVPGAPGNGWENWFTLERGKWVSLWDLRERYREKNGLYE